MITKGNLAEAEIVNGNRTSLTCSLAKPMTPST
jgi:hypothetical protein